MSRKDESLLDSLALCPWWVSVALSLIVFLLLRFVLAAIEFENFILKAFANGASKGALFEKVIRTGSPILLINQIDTNELL